MEDVEYSIAYTAIAAGGDKYHITNLSQLQDPKIAALFDREGDSKADLAECNLG